MEHVSGRVAKLSERLRIGAETTVGSDCDSSLFIGIDDFHDSSSNGTGNCPKPLYLSYNPAINKNRTKQKFLAPPKNRRGLGIFVLKGTTSDACLRGRAQAAGLPKHRSMQLDPLE